MRVNATRTVVLVGLVVVAFGVVAAPLDSGVMPEGSDDDRMDRESSPSGNVTGGDSTGTPPTIGTPTRSQDTPTTEGSGSLGFFGVIGALAVAAGVGLFYLATGDVSVGDIETADPPEKPDLQAVGEAAGEAADRIANDADVDNQVFRAWREMVRHLDVSNPEATTPDEFERAAVEAGMREADVATITRLFEDVRYGGRDPETRAERAIDALRRIEAQYAGEDENDGGDDGP